jgi:hypothetical protein
MRKNGPLLIIISFLLSVTTTAQPLTMDTAVHPTELKLIKFSPKNQPKGKGWINITTVKQVNDTAYYFCKGLSIYSPAAVIVAAKDKSIPVQASLHKWNWKETSRKGGTNANGTWMEKFKTENDFGLMIVASQKPVEYVITVWVGDEADVEVPSDFKSADNKETTPISTPAEKMGSSGFKKNIPYIIIIGVLAVVVALLLYNRKKRKA